MNAKDYFKKSILDSFTVNNGLTLEFMVSAAVAIAFAIFFGFLICLIYRFYYSGVVFSATFAATLVGMTILTCALTLAISSNIVISLGMVGALSIVRYRTAIKDSMDLLYLFWAISIGIIVAANLYPLAILTMVVMYIFIVTYDKFRDVGKSCLLIIHYTNEDTEGEIRKILNKQKYKIRSKVINEEFVELTIELAYNRNSLLFVDKINALDNVKDINFVEVQE